MIELKLRQMSLRCLASPAPLLLMIARNGLLRLVRVTTSLLDFMLLLLLLLLLKPLLLLSAFRKIIILLVRVFDPLTNDFLLHQLLLLNPNAIALLLDQAKALLRLVHGVIKTSTWRWRTCIDLLYFMLLCMVTMILLRLGWYWLLLLLLLLLLSLSVSFQDHHHVLVEVVIGDNVALLLIHVLAQKAPPLHALC